MCSLTGLVPVQIAEPPFVNLDVDELRETVNSSPLTRNVNDAVS